MRFIKEGCQVKYGQCTALSFHPGAMQMGMLKITRSCK